MKTLSELTKKEGKKFSDFCSKLLSKKLEPPDSFVKELLDRYETAQTTVKIADANIVEYQKQRVQAQAQAMAHAESIDSWIIWHLFGDEEKEGSEPEKADDSPPVEAEVH